MTSPKKEYEIENLNFMKKMSQLDPAKHLKEKENKYIMNPHLGGNIFVVRETEEGWWREEIEFKGDTKKQIEELQDDKTVAVGWFGSPRFTSKNGGWS